MKFHRANDKNALFKSIYKQKTLNSKKKNSDLTNSLLCTSWGSPASQKHWSSNEFIFQVDCIVCDNLNGKHVFNLILVARALLFIDFANWWKNVPFSTEYICGAEIYEWKYFVEIWSIRSHSIRNSVPFILLQFRKKWYVYVTTFGKTQFFLFFSRRNAKCCGRQYKKHLLRMLRPRLKILIELYLGNYRTIIFPIEKLLTGYHYHLFCFTEPFK